MVPVKQNLPIDVLITSVLLAFFVDIKVLNLLMLPALPSLEGSLMSILYSVVVALLFFMGCFRQGRSLSGLKPVHIWICILCTFWYMMTETFIAPPSVSILYFGVFFIASFMMPGMIRVDIRTLLLACLLIPAIGVHFLDEVIFREVEEEGLLSMGACYSILVPVMANLVYMKFYYSEESTLNKVLLIPFMGINLYYFVQMAMFGSRGPVLCALLLIASFFFVRVSKDGGLFFSKGRFYIMLLVGFFIMLLFKPILYFISDYLSGYDISLNVVDKFLMLDAEGDMTNGRDSIDIIAWDAIWNSPWLGYGIAQFEENTGVVYPHNFLVQFLYDGGVVLTLCVLVPIIKSLIEKIAVFNKGETVCLLFLFFSSVPGALFSGDLWESSILWLFFGFALSEQSVYDGESYCNV